MSTTPIKSAKVRNAVKTALGAAVAVPLMFGALPASAASGQVGDTTFDLSGYVKFDALYDIDGVSSVSGPMASDAATLIGKDNKTGNLKTTVNQTRLRLGTDTATQFGNVHGYIEMDFESGVSGHDLRRRLAYVQWNGWTIGRAWSTFSDFHYGTTLNFNGPTAQINQRADLVRYTVDMGDAGTFDVSLEKSLTQNAAIYDANGNWVGTKADLTILGFTDDELKALGIDNPIKIGGAATGVQQLPALAMRYSGAAGILDYQVAGIVRQNKYEWAGGSDSKVGWGLDAGAGLSLDSGTTLQLTGSYGEGINDGGYGYLYLGSTGYIQDGNAKNNKIYGFIASVGQKITDQLSTNLLYSMSWAEEGPDQTKTEGRTLAVNLMYSPVKPLVFGIEYSRAHANIHGDGEGGASANAVQFSTIYNF